jgi:hypothetical protein
MKAKWFFLVLAILGIVFGFALTGCSLFGEITVSNQLDYGLEVTVDDVAYTVYADNSVTIQPKYLDAYFTITSPQGSNFGEGSVEVLLDGEPVSNGLFEGNKYRVTIVAAGAKTLVFRKK